MDSTFWLIAYALIGMGNAWSFLFANNQMIRLLNLIAFAGAMTMITIMGING